MEYSFTAWGHENITGTHKRTLEFTRDGGIGIEGDCIIGVNANFSVYDLKELVKEGGKLRMLITVDEVSDEVVFEPNPDFNDEKEIVVRRGDFSSERTLGIKADKACADLKRELIEKLKNPGQRIGVLIITL